MKIIAVGLLYLGIMGAEAPYLVKNKLWRELLAFSALLLLAMFYSFGLMLGWRLPNLVDGLEALFIPVTRFMENLMG